MRKYASRLILILVVVAVGFACLWPPQQKLKLGIDLAGGTILVYQIQQESRPAGFDMDQMLAALSKRINPTGTLDVTLRPLGSDRIEIILPAAEPHEVQAVQDRITRLGQLEFRILANEKHDGSAIRQAREMWRRKAAQTAPRGYEWIKLAEPDEFNQRGERPGEDVAVEDGYVLTKVPDQRIRVTGDDLVRAYSTQDERMQLAVGFQFNSRGERKFAHLTRKYQPEPDGFQYRLAIILDRELMSAPVIKEPITGGQGRIDGGRDGFDPQECDDLIAVLNAGKLPAMLDPTPVSKDTITATLGEDTIRKGKHAIAAAMIAVPLFMLLYYMFAGLVANIALFLNMVLILGFMGLTRSTFTLPGLAGLALTIGMAVDANVLIFERIREERQRGSALAQAVRNGYDRAWFAILDSNLTTILTGLVLYWIGTDQVKGFALTLTVGLAINLFTAVFVSRVIFGIWLQERWLRRLRMLSLMRPPNFDFVGVRYYFIAGSLVAILFGTIAVAARGRHLLDIEFTGGSAISIRFKEPPPGGTEYVRATALAAPELPNVKVERLILEGETKEQVGRRFLLRTTNTDQKAVRAAVMRQFQGQLATLQLLPPFQPQRIPTAEQAQGGKKQQQQAAATGDKSTEQPQEDRQAQDPFAGGWRVELTVNEPVGTETLARHFDQVLSQRGVSQPHLLYALQSRGREGELSRRFVLETRYQKPVELLQAVNAAFQKEPIFERENNFGSQVAGETQQKAILAILLSWCVIVAYLGLRFKDVSHGLAAVVALVHDVLIALSSVAIAAWLARIPVLGSALLLDEFKIDLSVVAAFLTIVGYSVNDTIVIFDRIRELRGKAPFITPDMINAGINQCLSRTILTSLTTFLVVLVLYVWGGPGIHAFSFVVMIGVITGTYSTMFIASPILVVFAGKSQAQWQQKRVRYQRATARV